MVWSGRIVGSLELSLTVRGGGDAWFVGPPIESKLLEPTAAKSILGSAGFRLGEGEGDGIEGMDSVGAEGLAGGTAVAGGESRVEVVDWCSLETMFGGATSAKGRGETERWRAGPGRGPSGLTPG